MIRVEYSNDYLVPHKEVRNATPATGSETPDEIPDTPITDAATHDDWSGGAEATEPEVSRKLECDLTIARRHVAILERQLAESRAENERLKAELEGHAFELSPAMVQARNDQLNADNAALRAECDRLTAECEKDLTWTSNFLSDLIAGRALRPTQIRIGLEMRRDSLRSVLTAAKPEERA